MDEAKKSELLELQQQLQRHQEEIAILKLFVAAILDRDPSYAQVVKGRVKLHVENMRAAYASHGAAPASLALKEAVLKQWLASTEEVLGSQSSAMPPSS